MSGRETTCWTMIRDAAAGDDDGRRAFAARYADAVRGYLVARWRGTGYIQSLDDAVQEVFVESFRDGGALERVDDDRPGGFRAYLYGLVRNVALRVETRAARSKEGQAPTAMLDGPDEARLSRVFDRSWARSIMRDAARRMDQYATDDDARRHVELLHLRFGEGMPIRDIAARWEADPVQVHRQYAKARAAFREALLEVVAEHVPGDPAAAERECGELLAMLE